ncbi:FAD-dependent oxidoreductase [Bradyrhizobium sp. LHD-71]|uniref:phytoene desaturase family protein n=1 Tax=Bradyrhizobium sp. LHD-71 TaxID=3072141 RepID=UPI00280D39C1|nr:FAD-dependent oxidoreductase [Bradyrhizobium sp. LHD-71]MDQ8726785.1 FAD-dependent oxidoreductase [Bradyrhizobium sp. LHD-71]
MARYDVVVIGAGLGGLTAGAILAREGRKVLLIERGNSVGGAASSYKAGDLFIEASLHKTSGPEDARDLKHLALTRAGVLDKVEWVSTGSVFEVRGGPLREPFMLPANFAAAREALTQRFPDARDGIASILHEMERLADAAGTLAREGRFRNTLENLDALKAALPEIHDWDLSLAQKFDAAFGGNEAVKCALAGNLWHYHDDPASLWWIFFATAQGGYLQSGGRYVKTGSQRLSSALARTILRSEGCAIALRRVATGIGVDAQGRANSVTHIAKAGGDPQTDEADCIVSNAAPGVAAALLPEAEGSRLSASYAGRKSSVSLFALTLGLSCKPDAIGLTSYSTQLLPEWMASLADYAKGSALFADEPAARMPPFSIVNYSAIDSGVPVSPFIVSVVGTDRLANWEGMERSVYTAKRGRWRDAIVAHLDGIYPGLQAAAVASSFNTASSMVSYLNAPDGAAYGFAPNPPDASHTQSRSPQTVIDRLYLASSYAGYGGYNGAIQAGQACADTIIGAG